VTGEVVALYDAWLHVNRSDRDRTKGRVFIAKAIILLARCQHSRDADELNILFADRLPDDQFQAALDACEGLVSTEDLTWHDRIPAYVYDVHTRRGRAAGKTKQDFLRDEHAALTDPVTMFANFDEMVDSPIYVAPELDLDLD
jgi:hypothetical protein